MCGEGVVVVGRERVEREEEIRGGQGGREEEHESDTHATLTGFARAGQGSYGWPC